MKPQKNIGIFLVVRPLRGGGEGKGLATEKKERFLKIWKKIWKNICATKLEEGGGRGKALVAGPLKKERYFIPAPLKYC